VSPTELPLSKLVATTAAERLLQRPSKAVFDFMQQDREMAGRLLALVEQLDSHLLQVPAIEGLMAEPLASSLAAKLQHYSPSQQSEAVQELIDRSAGAQIDKVQARKQSSHPVLPTGSSVEKTVRRNITSGDSQSNADKSFSKRIDAREKQKTQKWNQPTSKSAAAKRVHSDAVIESADKQSKQTIFTIPRKPKIGAEQARQRLAARAEQAGAATAWRTPVTTVSNPSLATTPTPPQGDAKERDETYNGPSPLFVDRQPSPSYVERQIDHYLQKEAPNLERCQEEPATQSGAIGANAGYVKGEKTSIAGAAQKKAYRPPPSTPRPRHGDIKEPDETYTGARPLFVEQQPSRSYVERQIDHYLQKVAPNLERYQEESAAQRGAIGTNTRYIKREETSIAGATQKKANRPPPSLEHVPTDAVNAREQSIGFARKTPAVGGLRGLAARASGPLAPPEVSCTKGEAIARQPISAEAPISSPITGQQTLQQTEQRMNVSSSSSQAVAMPQVEVVSGNINAATQRSLAADIAEIIAEEARRAGIDVEQFRP